MEEKQCFNKPDGLSAAGELAWKTVTALLRKDGSLFAGGCKAFYSPAEWRERGEEYGCDSELVVVHDGGEHARYFNYDHGDYSAIERMQAALALAGLWAEACTCWYSCVYKD
jgi:hypothetical protein